MQKYSKPIVDKFLDGVEKPIFNKKNVLAKAAENTLNSASGLKAFLNLGFHQNPGILDQYMP